MPPRTPKPDPLAIVGMAYRFPGSASNDQKLWEILENGRSAWSKIPESRFSHDAYYHPDAQRTGSIAAKGGYFLEEDPAAFDAPFFGCSPAEAGALDPQQRYLLETTYECLESAGVPLNKIRGTNTGCFTGSFLRDYDSLSSADIMDIPTYAAISSGCFLSNRVSWFFDLKGPSLTLDTVCSSSLVAFHLACQSVWTGECDQALAAGSNLILMPNSMRALTQLQFLSPDGVCKSFDAGANGYARGEGVAVLLIKPVEAAIRDGDCIRAIVRGSASNQNGRTPGITMPSTEAQASLIRTAYESHGLDMHTTGYFEAHGTGTPIGDPLEFNAIAQTLVPEDLRTFPLVVGSVKSNIGHLEGTAGLAGLVKAILCVEKGMIPPIAGFQSPNPKLKLDDPSLQLATRLSSWPNVGIRRASINSFGAGGSNAHVIIDDAPSYLKSVGLHGHHQTIGIAAQPDSDSGLGSQGSSSDDELSDLTSKAFPQIIAFSAPEQAALQRTSISYSRFLEAQLSTPLSEEALSDQKVVLDEDASPIDIKQLAETLCSRRTEFEWKSFVVASSTRELQSSLMHGLQKFPKQTKTTGIGFVFTGQGAQAAQMGVGLLQYQVFMDHLKEADAFLRTLGCPWSVIEEIRRDQSSTLVDDPRYAQPLCTVLQTGLVDLLSSWGVMPKHVVGHSSGEIAAAYASHALTKQQAWKVAYFRGYWSGAILDNRQEAHGSMLAVGLGENDATAFLKSYSDPTIVVACMNSPSSVTFSGPTSSILKVRSNLSHDDIYNTLLRVKVAYHSPAMQAISEDYLNSLGDIQPMAGSQVTMYSSVTGAAIEPSTMTAQYWLSNMLSPVRFTTAVEKLLAASAKVRGRRKTKLSVDTLIELGPHGTLQESLKQIANLDEKEYDQLTFLSILYRGKDASRTALEAMGRLWTRGHSVNLSLINRPTKKYSIPAPMTQLPPYQWNRDEKNHHWHEGPLVKLRRIPKGPRTDLLGVLEDDNSHTPTYRNLFRLEESPWLVDHNIQGMIVFPASGFIVMSIEAALRSSANNKIPARIELRDIIIQRALLFQDPNKPVETRCSLQPHKMGTRLSSAPWTSITIYSRSALDESWDEHSSCLFMVHYRSEPSDVEGISELSREAEQHQQIYHDYKQKCTVETSAASVYGQMATSGFHYGPAFKNLRSSWSGDRIATGTFIIPDTATAMPKNFEFPHVVHPAAFDSFFHLVVPALRTIGMNSTMLPTAVGSLVVDLDIPSEAGTELNGYVSVKQQGAREIMSTIVISRDGFEKPLVLLKDLYCQEVAGIMNIQRPGVSNAKHIASEIQWAQDVQFLQTSALIQQLQTSSAPPMHRTDTEELQTLDSIASKMCDWIAAWHTEDLAAASNSALASLSYYISAASTRKKADSAGPKFNSAVLEASQLARNLQALWEDIKFLRQSNTTHLRPREACAGLTEALNNLESTKSLSPLLVALADLQAFKTPALKVLELGSSGPEICSLVLQKLSDQGRPLRLEKFFISSALAKPPWVANLQKTNPKFVEYYQFELLDKGLEGIPVEDGSLDLVICSNALVDDTAASTAANHAFRMLKPGGKFSTIVTTKTSGAVDLIRASSTLYLGPHTVDPSSCWLFGEGSAQTQFHDTLVHAGFADVEAVSSDLLASNTDAAAIFIATKPHMIADLDRSVLLIEPTLHNSHVLSLMSALENDLKALGQEVSRAQIQQLPAVEDKFVISFAELDHPILGDIHASDFANWKRLLRSNKGLLWLSRGAQITNAMNPLAGLTTGALRTARAENPHLRLVHFDLCETTPLEAQSTASTVFDVFKNTVLAPEGAKIESELAMMSDQVVIPRLFTHHDMNSAIHYHKYRPDVVRKPLAEVSQALQLTVGSPGMLDTLQFIILDSASKDLPMGSAKVKVTATPINFVDVMVAMGMVPAFGIGCECAGVIVESHAGGRFSVGDEVVLLTSSAFSNFVVEDESMMQPIPKGMTAAEAASCVTIYVTAYIALFEVARLQKGESVLIHAGAGGLGQAAIQLCQMLGAEIFVTVGSTAKKALLMETYGIASDHVFNSRDLSFASGIMRQTKQRGVDVILNSTSGEALRQTWHCIAPYGRFLEVGKRDIIMNTGLDMAPFLRNVTYSGVHIDQMVGPAKQRVSEAMAKVFDLLVLGKIGVVHPVTLMTYTKLEEAFRLVQQGKHSGKVVLTASDDDVVPVVPRVIDSLILRPDRTYAIGGGLGGVGRSIVDMMYNHGARHFAFFSRSGDSRPDAKTYLAALRLRGASARAFKADLGNYESLSHAIDEMKREMPPVAGFLNSAMNLQDSLLDLMTHEQWVQCLAPKVDGSWNFHKLLPNNLDFFVLLSSIASIIGHPGQTNYAAANAYQDMLAHHRRSLNLKAVSLNLGAIFGVGHIEENNKEDQVRMKLYELVSIDERELQILVASAMKNTTTTGRPLPTQLVTGINPEVLNVSNLKWAEDPKFDIIRRKGGMGDDGAADESAKTKLLDDIANCATLTAAAAVIEEAMLIKLARSMMVKPEDISTQKPLSSFGVDSLVAVEVRNWIFKELKSEVTVFDLMDPQPVSALVFKIAERSKLLSDEVRAKGKEDSG